MTVALKIEIKQDFIKDHRAIFSMVFFMPYSLFLKNKTKHVIAIQNNG